MANRGSATRALATLAMAWIIVALPGGAHPRAAAQGAASGPRDAEALRDAEAAQPPIASRARVDEARALHHLSRGSQA